MGDMGEYFNDVRKAGQEKRARNREQSPELLKASGIAFEAFNGGAHLRVEHNDMWADFYPGTGRWRIQRGRGKERRLVAMGRGVRKLIKRLNA